MKAHPGGKEDGKYQDKQKAPAKGTTGKLRESKAYTYNTEKNNDGSKIA
ncbi:MAG: hypothetical protein M3Q26_09955 [Acidobacteriota bacterium]|nr:hypothetical protein [Acidobacteriota bacterium]